VWVMLNPPVFPHDLEKKTLFLPPFLYVQPFPRGWGWGAGPKGPGAAKVACPNCVKGGDPKKSTGPNRSSGPVSPHILTRPNEP